MIRIKSAKSKNEILVTHGTAVENWQEHENIFSAMLQRPSGRIYKPGTNYKTMKEAILDYRYKYFAVIYVDNSGEVSYAHDKMTRLDILDAMYKGEKTEKVLIFPYDEGIKTVDYIKELKIQGKYKDYFKIHPELKAKPRNKSDISS